MRFAVPVLLLVTLAPAGVRAEGIQVAAPEAVAFAWRNALAIELAGSHLSLSRGPSDYRVGLTDTEPAHVYVMDVRTGRLVSTPVTDRDGRTLAMITTSLLTELGVGPTASVRLGDPGTPPAPPRPALHVERPPPPSADPRTYVYFAFDVGPVFVFDPHDAPWGIVSRVFLGYQVHELARIALSVEGGMLAEQFSHNQPLLSICAEPTFSLPVDWPLIEIRAGAKGCLSAGRLRDGGADPWRYGAALGGHLAGVVRITRMLRLVLRFDAEGWAPDALGGEGGGPRDWATVLGGLAGTELRF